MNKCKVLKCSNLKGITTKGYCEDCAFWIQHSINYNKRKDKEEKKKLMETQQ